jgi:hypothetical protein
MTYALEGRMAVKKKIPDPHKIPPLAPRASLAFLFALALVSAAASGLSSQEFARERWFRAGDRDPSGRARAYALMIHGLNLKPEKMGDIAGILNSEGIDVLNLGLRGHNGDTEAFRRVTRDQWLADALQGYRDLKAEAGDSPVYFVGFSLGAVLGVDLLARAPSNGVGFAKMVLIAPALALRPRNAFVCIFGLFGPGFILPSLDDPAYRANRGGTSMSAYAALFGLVGELGEPGLSNANIPTLLLVDPQDELVSESGIRDLILRRNLSRWELRDVSAAGPNRSVGHHHRIVDEESLGPEAWRELSQEILSFLGS